MSAIPEAPPLLDDDLSWAERLIAPVKNLPDETRAQVLGEQLAQLDDDELRYLLSWDGQARPSQRIATDGTEPPFVAFLGGRGSGKTRAGAEAVCDRIEADQLHSAGFIARVPADVREIMLGGESGFRACCERRGIRLRPGVKSLRIVDGGTIETFSAHVPDSIRGRNFDTVWGDEFSIWPQKVDPQGNTAFSNTVATLRLGGQPLGIFTLTPRPVLAVREVLTDRTGLWRVVRMTTWQNAANLAPGFLATLLKLYGGTRLAAQEFDGLYVDDVEGALWTTIGIEGTRVPLPASVQHLAPADQIMLGLAEAEQVSGGLPFRFVTVDPSVAEDGGGDECGIVAGGVGYDNRLYVFADVSGHLPAHVWPARAAWLWRLIGANSIVAEGNQGGALVAESIRNIDPTIPVETVWARNGKRARAEPVANLWTGLHPLASIVGSLPALEAEMTGWDSRSNVSPNRIDALAWLGHQAFGHLFSGEAQWSADLGSFRLPL